jgi:hypothetical protein
VLHRQPVDGIPNPPRDMALDATSFQEDQMATHDDEPDEPDEL